MFRSYDSSLEQLSCFRLHESQIKSTFPFLISRNSKLKKRQTEKHLRNLISSGIYYLCIYISCSDMKELKNGERQIVQKIK
mmetsp:Transcript_10432/g.13037  ORF Transcript_10432/g.13037 Transcript_10432/m.13037 type:complete len:81 (+) Transcript_10432:3532-3774(+)